VKVQAWVDLKLTEAGRKNYEFSGRIAMAGMNNLLPATGVLSRSVPEYICGLINTERKAEK